MFDTNSILHSCCLIGIDGPAAFQDDVQEVGSQVQILTVGEACQDEDEGETLASNQQQSKQDLRVTMQKKGKGPLKLGDTSDYLFLIV